MFKKLFERKKLYKNCKSSYSGWLIFTNVVFCICWFHIFACAQVQLEVSKEYGKKISVAISDFNSSAGTVSNSSSIIHKILRFDLDHSGFFQVVPEKICRQLSRKTSKPDIKLWKSTGAALLVTGGINQTGNQVELEGYIYDLQGGGTVFAKKYTGSASRARRLAHAFAEDILYRITGEHGYFLARIAYTREINGVKEIVVSDSDGGSPVPVTSDRSIAMIPEWSPVKQQLIYTSYRTGYPRLYIHDVEKGKRWSLPSYPGLNAAASISPNGNEIAMVLSKDGNPEIYVCDFKGKNLRRITKTKAVESSPCWSPDGKSIVFVSNRGGAPKLYIINSDGSGMRRIPSSGRHNTDPDWSPKGNMIVYCSRSGVKSAIMLINLNNGENRMLTDFSGTAEDPSWASDGRHIVFTKKVGREMKLFLMDTLDGSSVQISGGKGNHVNPSFSVN
ncbi:MAG: Tol-Pal system beta propeller repeat protein TolB [Candidatus Theseobacter exili]|nr:Tol-Pal system beta propeller repeat protein TolB [Candidatus Theseobacter exili]